MSTIYLAACSPLDTIMMIEGAIEKKPKSIGWKLRAKVGTKKKW